MQELDFLLSLLQKRGISYTVLEGEKSRYPDGKGGYLLVVEADPDIYFLFDSITREFVGLDNGQLG